RSGLLVRDRRGLEEARKLDAIVFDKTGTLSLGEHRVVDMLTRDGLTADDALALAAAAESDSEHPVARAVVESAREREIPVPAASGFEAAPGLGVRATVDGREVQVGGPNLVSSVGASLPRELEEFTASATA